MKLITLLHSFSELQKRIFSAIVFGTIAGAIFLYLPPAYFSLMLLFVWLAIVIFELPPLFTHNRWWWLVSPLYPTLSFAMLISLNHCQHTLVGITLILIFCHDIGAYFVGQSFGKHRIAPRISPKKSWEGFIGGLLATAVGLTAIIYIKCKTMDITFIALASIIIAMLATLGDFFESWLKRQAQLKDSGSAMPGHGGFLDRFDSISFVMPLVWMLQDYIAKQLCL